MKVGPVPLRAVLLAACAACSPSRDAPPAEPDVALTLPPSEELFTVGSEEGEAWSVFGRITAVTFDRANNLYVLDRQNHRVVVFDSTGAFVREFGREGGGPGEFSLPTEVAVAPNGNVIVSDGRNRAFVVFDASGEHLFNVPFDDLASTTNDGLIAIADTAAVVLTSGQRRRDGRIARLVRVPLRENASYVPIDSIRLVEWLTFDIPATASTPAMTLSRSPVYSPELLLAHLSGALVAVYYDTEYRIELYHAASGRQQVITRSIPPVTVGSAEREQWHQRLDSARSLAGSTGPLPYDVPFAERMAVISRMKADPSGGLWVQRHLPDGRAEGPIDLFDASGAYVGTLSPREMPVALGYDGRAAWIVEDSLGVARVSVRSTGVDWPSLSTPRATSRATSRATAGTTQ